MRAAGSNVDHDLSGPIPSPGQVAFIITRMKAAGFTNPQMASCASISRTRMYAIAHSVAEKRIPMRMSEIKAILDVLGITALEATIGAQLIESAPHASDLAVARIPSFLTKSLSGLSAELVTIIQDIDGVEFDDIRPEHGHRVREVIVDYVKQQYSKMAKRRDFRQEGEST